MSRTQKEVWCLRFSKSPPMKLKDIAARLGVGLSAVAQRWARGREVLGRAPDLVRASAEVGPTGAVPTTALAELAEQKLRMAMECMDAARFRGATFQHLAQGARSLMDIRQVLRGEPMQIIRHEEDRKGMTKLMELILKEATRRGIEVRHDPALGGPVVETRAIDAGSET